MSDIEKQKGSGLNDGMVTVQTNDTDYVAGTYTNGTSGPKALEEGHRLKQKLQPRQISMIAIGGALGTGLLVGTTSTLSSAGPGGLLIAYSFIGIVVYFVMCALGEMCAFIPLPEGFPGYATRYCDPALGYGVGMCYLCSNLISTPNELVAGSLVMQYWVPRSTMNPGIWIMILIIVIVSVNLFQVGIYGEFEFYLSSLKVCTIVGLNIVMIVILLGGAPNHDRLGFRYWTDPGSFASYPDIHPGSAARFVAFVSVLVNAVFAYLGVELVGMTFGEAQNARYTIKKAIRLTAFRIIAFYVFSVLFLGCCVAYNDQALVEAQTQDHTAAASAFVVAISHARITGLPHVINACIFIFVFSAANSCLYVTSRTSYALACQGMLPSIFSRTNKAGVPYYGVALGGLFSCLAFMVCSQNSRRVFSYFVNVVSVFGLINWISILVSYIHFHRAIVAQGVDRSKFVYKAPFQPYASYVVLALCIVVALIKNFTVFIGDFDYQNFITGYIGIPVYLVAIFGFKFIKKSKMVVPEEADLITYKAPVDADQYAYEKKMAEKEERRIAEGRGKDREWWYDHTLGYLF